MITVKVLGIGCANCHRLEQLARKAAGELAVEFRVEKVTDYEEILAHNVLATPGLVINERVVSSSRLPSVAEITGWLVAALQAAETL